MKATEPVSPSAPPYLGEVRADAAGGAVAVVGQRLDDHGDAARAIALVAHLLVVLGVAAHRLLDGALDIVLGHVLGARVLDGEAQARIHVRVGRAHLRRDGDFAGELGEELRAPRIGRALACMMFLNWEWPAMECCRNRAWISVGTYVDRWRVIRPGWRKGRARRRGRAGRRSASIQARTGAATVSTSRSPPANGPARG